LVAGSFPALRETEGVVAGRWCRLLLFLSFIIEVGEMVRREYVS
jgi:hypothetical protein